MSLKLSLDHLLVIDAIARKGSFAAAAEALHRVPSAVTYTIRKLEDDLAISIFDRSGHRAKLTPAGEELLKEGRHLIDAAHTLECRVKRIATGIETDITIAISDLFDSQSLLSILNDFYAEALGTRVKITREVFGGSWDALISNRADISLGAPGEAPSGAGFATKLIGEIDFVFVVAPNHPLATIQEPLSKEHIMQYRAVAAADSSRNLPPRTSGIINGQDVLTVPDMKTKLSAQIHGLGVGYLPIGLAMPYVEQNKLIIKQVSEPKISAPTYLAWRHQGAATGRAKTWFIKALSQLTINDLI